MPQSARLIRVMGLRIFLRCYAVAEKSVYNVMVSHIAVFCNRTNDRITREAIARTRVHPHGGGRSKTFIKWPSDEQAASISTLRRSQLTCGSYLLSHGKPWITSNLSSKSKTMKSSSYYISFSVQVISTTRLITVTDTPAPAFLFGGISRSINLSLLSASDWRRKKNSTPHNRLGHQVTTLLSLQFQVTEENLITECNDTK